MFHYIHRMTVSDTVSGTCNSGSHPCNYQRWRYILKYILMNQNVCILIQISLKFLPMYPIHNKSALTQVKAWCRQATSLYLNQYWIWSMMPYGHQSPMTFEHEFLRYGGSIWRENLAIRFCFKELQNQLEQLESLRSEIPPTAPWLPILVIHIRSQVKTRQCQSYKFKKIQIFKFRKKLYMPHTFWSCLIRHVNMKWIEPKL